MEELNSRNQEASQIKQLITDGAVLEPRSLDPVFQFWIPSIMQLGNEGRLSSSPSLGYVRPKQPEDSEWWGPQRQTGVCYQNQPAHQATASSVHHRPCSSRSFLSKAVRRATQWLPSSASISHIFTAGLYSLSPGKRLLNRALCLKLLESLFPELGSHSRSHSTLLA